MGKKVLALSDPKGNRVTLTKASQKPAFDKSYAGFRKGSHHNTHGIPSHVLQGHTMKVRQYIPSNSLMQAYGRVQLLTCWLMA